MTPQYRSNQSTRVASREHNEGAAATHRAWADWLRWRMRIYQWWVR